MKKLLLTTLMATALASPMAYTKHAGISHDGKTIIAHVEGMVCDFCARGLEKTFGKKDEVNHIIISLEQGAVTIQMNPDHDLADEEIIEIIKDNGINTTSINRGVTAE